MLPTSDYCYCLVRTDIALADQIVQVGHACIAAALQFSPRACCRLVVLSVPGREDLLAVGEVLGREEIRYSLFFEPDNEMGFTALATEPLNNVDRKVFKRMKLWRAPSCKPGQHLEKCPNRP